MATFTLTDLQNEVSKKYAPTVIENNGVEYVLPNLLQLDAKARDKALKKIESMEGDEDDSLEFQLTQAKGVLQDVTKDGKGKELVGLLGDNPAMILELIESWMEGTQPGEAEQSSK